MYRKNVASQNLPFALVNAATGAALTGATVTARRSIDGAAQASATGSVSELGNGQYNLALSQADTNGNNIGILLTATSAIPVHFSLVLTAANPTDANLGLTNLDAAVSSRASQTSVDDLPTNAELATALGTSDDATLAAIAALNDLSSADVTAAVPTAVQNADALLDRNMGTGTDSGSPSVRTPRQALRALRNRVFPNAGTLTVYKEDDTTASWTAAYTTDSGADPITEVNPA